MEYAKKSSFFVVLFALCFATTMSASYVQPRSENCYPSNPEREAFKMMPCMAASKDPYYPVSQRCCDQVRKLGQSTSCLCAVMLSNTAKMVGSKPQVAITIPKRCDIVERPVGYNCGGYELP